MPAPDFQTLYDFETQMEDCWQTVLAALLLAANFPVPVTITRDKTINDSPRIELSFATGNAMAQRTAIGQATPKQVPNAFEGVLTVRLFTTRPLEAENNAIHGQLRGFLRYALSAGAKNITTGNLPYLQILEMLPAGTQLLVTDPKEQDETQLSYHVWFAINNSAWPASP